MKKKFENSLFKNFVYSKEYIIVLFIILLSLPFIKYLNSSCSDLSEEQQCVCWDITNFQLDGKNPEIKGKFIDACSKFRDIKLNSE